MKVDGLEIPDDVIAAARCVSSYFRERGVIGWALEGCVDRNTPDNWQRGYTSGYNDGVQDGKRSASPPFTGYVIDEPPAGRVRG